LFLLIQCPASGVVLCCLLLILFFFRADPSSRSSFLLQLVGLVCRWSVLPSKINFPVKSLAYFPFPVSFQSGVRFACRLRFPASIVFHRCLLTILDPSLFSLLPVDSLARALDLRSVGGISFWRVAIERRCLFYSCVF
jgi:hypothetical protein